MLQPSFVAPSPPGTNENESSMARAPGQTPIPPMTNWCLLLIYYSLLHILLPNSLYNCCEGPPCSHAASKREHR